MFYKKLIFTVILFSQISFVVHAGDDNETQQDGAHTPGPDSSLDTLEQSFEQVPRLDVENEANQFDLLVEQIRRLSDDALTPTERIVALIDNIIQHFHLAPPIQQALLHPVREANFNGMRYHWMTEWLRELLGDEHPMVLNFEHETRNEITTDVNDVVENQNPRPILLLAQNLEQIGDPYENVAELRETAQRLEPEQRLGPPLPPPLPFNNTGEQQPAIPLPLDAQWNEAMRAAIRQVEDAEEIDYARLYQIINLMAEHPERAPNMLQAVLLERIRLEQNLMLRIHLIVQLFEELFVMTHIIDAFNDEIMRQAHEYEQNATTPTDYIVIAVLYERMGWTERADYMHAEARRVLAWLRPILNLGVLKMSGL